MTQTKVLQFRIRRAQIHTIKFKREAREIYGSRSHWPNFIRDQYEELKDKARALRAQEKAA
jgi:hypothetical protein